MKLVHICYNMLTIL
ncbi:UNVERIFIED_CONTAM: hypothetical protein GTU68_062601 [Idotea baltica]|nr:hypothetical protein [Idotea baltica]